MDRKTVAVTSSKPQTEEKEKTAEQSRHILHVHVYINTKWLWAISRVVISIEIASARVERIITFIVVYDRNNT